MLGKTKQDYASILRWCSFANTTIISNVGNYAMPLLFPERMAYNKKAVEEAGQKTTDAMSVLDDHLLVNTYLVSERITLADVVVASLIYRVFADMYGKQWRDEHPNVTRWFDTIINQPIWTAVVPSFTYAAEDLKNVPPAKPKKEEAPKAAPKPKAAAAAKDDDDDEPQQEAPKAKHPLEALGKASMPIDEWKRKYKNEETREVALPWFWKNMPFDEYSIWRFDFKYNEELTLTFMSNNQIGGFFNRLEASRKYIMGCGSVFGVTNDSVIQGAFVIRGQDWKPAFDVAPDFESYEFTKLDPKSESDRDFFDSMMAWDKPVEVKGKKFEFADGKIFV